MVNLGENALETAVAESVALTSGERELVHVLSTHIISLWNERAEGSDEPLLKFQELYRAHSQTAQASILAILELVKAVGTGQSMPSSYIPLLKKRGVTI